jgi:DNA repair protein RecO (recombination protein O)
MRIELQPAYVLHRRPYRNTSAIIDVFSRDYGRIGLVARGLLNPRSRNGMQALLQPFNKILLSWTGRGELRTLIQAESAANTDTRIISASASMFYLNELLMRLLQRDDPHEQLFLFYEASLMSLQASTMPPQHDEFNLRLFEKNLLDELGYGLVLDSDSTGANIEPDIEYRYIPELGPVINTPTLTGGVLLHGASLLALANEHIDSEQAMRESKQLMRFILRGYLGDKPLQSRMLYNVNY